MTGNATDVAMNFTVSHTQRKKIDTETESLLVINESCYPDAQFNRHCF